MQRRVVDFAADSPFGKVPEKLNEHYGITLGQEVIRLETLRHAEKMGEFFDGCESLPSAPGAVDIVAGTDGGMIPIVSFKDDSSVKDKRKKRKCEWKEGLLCFARDTQSVNGFFRATLTERGSLWERWQWCALQAGMIDSTKVHIRADGAAWIITAAENAFGAQGSFLTDFYHVGEYLAAAAKICAPDSADAWRRKQQARLKGPDLYKVLQALEEHLNDLDQPEHEDVRACYRYLTNRLEHLDYMSALDSGLPIGSGETESGHRHVWQHRMKRAGTWWTRENAEKMLQLLTLRTCGLWHDYWSKQRCVEDVGLEAQAA